MKDGKRKSLKVHRLVAISFIPNPMNKPYINHIDGNPINNCVENLEWCTQHENVVHAYKIGLRKISHITKEELQRYVENTMSRLSVSQIDYKTCKMCADANVKTEEVTKETDSLENIDSKNNTEEK